MEPLQHPDGTRAAKPTWRKRFLRQIPPPLPPLLCPKCGALVYESAEVRWSPLRRRAGRAAANRACSSCGADLEALLAQRKQQRSSRRTLRFLWRGTLATLAGVVLCLAAALILLTLQSPRVRIERPWFDPALEALQILTQLFLVACLLFKFALQMLDDRIARQEADLK